jgi:hypothetical protein
MKILFGLSILLALLLGARMEATTTAITAAAEMQGPAAEKGPSHLADLPLRSVSIKAGNIHLALSAISDTYKVPIGLEVSPDDDLLKERNIVVQLDRGTLRDVLDLVARRHPLYTWEIADGVVNAFPKGSREPMLKALLEARVGNFRVGIHAASPPSHVSFRAFHEFDSKSLSL